MSHISIIYLEYHRGQAVCGWRLSFKLLLKLMVFKTTCAGVSLYEIFKFYEVVVTQLFEGSI